MSCTNPRKAYQLAEYQGDTSPLVFARPTFDRIKLYTKLQVPCGKCEGCLGLRSMLRAIQLHCELQTTKGDSWFITFTYDDEHIPNNLSLYKPHITQFINLLRKYRIRNKHKGDFRYEQCGEYGTTTLRPHHHMSAFNLQIDDLEIYTNNGKYKTYSSQIINNLWPHGRVDIIELNFATCLYIAQHSDKKIGRKKLNHIPTVISEATGEISKNREPEYSTRSSNPGIGAEWWTQFGHTDLYNTDSIVIQGNQYKIPSYFDKQLKKSDPELYEIIKAARKEKAVQKTPKENAYQAKFNKVKYEQKIRNKV